MNQQILNALAFYADPKSYVSGHNGPDVLRDGGVKAKEALELAKQGWRPMDSAPRDRTEILVVNDRGTQRVCWSDEDRQGWVFYQKYAGPYVELLDPIAWMPLPSAPKLQETTDATR